MWTQDGEADVSVAAMELPGCLTTEYTFVGIHPCGVLPEVFLNFALAVSVVLWMILILC